MRLLIALALLLLPPVSSAADAPAAESYQLTLWSTIDVDILGQPARVEIHEADSYSPQLIARLQQRLALAEFDPPVVDGAPRAFSTPVRLVLEVQPTGDGGLVTLTEVTPTVRMIRGFQPYYPQAAAERSQYGEVMLRCDIGDDGRCREIVVEERTGPMMLARAATEALQKAEFEVPRVEGQPVDASIRKSYLFSLRSDTDDGTPEDAGRRLEMLGNEWFRMRRALVGLL